MLAGINRVYVNNKARAELGWPPHHDFRTLIGRLKADDDFRKPACASDRPQAPS